MNRGIDHPARLYCRSTYVPANQKCFLDLVDVGSSTLPVTLVHLSIYIYANMLFIDLHIKKKINLPDQRTLRMPIPIGGHR
jgi:hypothetical protein